MEQRPLRLGDLVDDYCPRERRLTNHSIVAIVGDEIRQTRCNTCEAEHVFKGGKVPVRKKKDTTAVLYDQVLANVAPVTTSVAVLEPAVETVAAVAEAAEAEPPPRLDQEPGREAEAPPVEERWTLHRTLIRATLPRTPDAVPPPRPIPEFTMHQRNVRGSHMFRQPHGHGMNGNGDGAARGGGFRDNNFRGDAQPGAPNGRPGGGGRRRRRSKKPRPTN